MSLKLFFLRHGQTAASRDNMFCGSGTDLPLTLDGQAMALAFADYYESTNWRAIYCSSLQRAISTAAPIAGVLGLQPQLRDDLMEIGYGDWEGKAASEVSADYHDDYIRWSADPAWHAPTNGEPANAIAHRGLRVIEEIKASFEDGNVLIVSHKATIRIILCSLLGIDVGRFRYRLGCPVGSVSVVEFGANGPLLHALADRTHFDARLRELPGT